MAEPMPFGLTFLLAIVRAIDSASFVKVPLGGRVDTVFTPRTHFSVRGPVRPREARRALDGRAFRVGMTMPRWVDTLVRTSEHRRRRDWSGAGVGTTKAREVCSGNVAAMRDAQDPLSRVVQLRASLREGVLDMRARRRELQQRGGELKACRQALGRACDELRDRLPNPSPPPTALTSPHPLPVEPREIFGILSPRQRRVLEGILAGKPNKAIAFDLGVSTKTVETHRARVMLKLDVESFADLVRICTVAGVRNLAEPGEGAEERPSRRRLRLRSVERTKRGQLRTGTLTKHG
jgi:DNA-binding CsgD family transcriptional regulator